MNSLETRLQQPIVAEGDLESDVVDLTTTIVAAAKDAIPRASNKLRTVSWWTKELEAERRRVRRL